MKICHNRANTYRNFLSNEQGSAVIEYVLLAIPLFLAIYLFLGNFAKLSDSEIVAQTLVRESLRAYVLSPNFATANFRAKETLFQLAQIEGLRKAEIDSMIINFSCNKFPCLSKEGRIKATLEMISTAENRKIRVSAEEIVSPWKWTY